MNHEINEIQLGHLKQAFAQCVFNHQVYEFAASRARRKENIVKVISLCLVLTTLLSLTNPSFPDIAGQIAGIAEIVLQLAQWYFGIGNSPIANEETARQYLALREKYLALIVDYKSNFLSDKELILSKKALNEQYIYISESAPQTEAKDYRKAQNALGTNGGGEGYTWSDKEIDRFLPV